MWELDSKENWALKNDAFELCCWRRLLRVPWTARRSNQSILNETSPGCSLEGLMLKLKLQYFWTPDAKHWLTGKDPDAGKDWGQEEKGMTEVEMAGWHHWLNGHDFGWTLGVGNEQGGLACCSSWCRKESGMTEGLNWTELSGSTLALPVFFLGLASSFRLQKSSHSHGPVLYSLVLLIFLCLLCSLLPLCHSLTLLHHVCGSVPCVCSCFSPCRTIFPLLLWKSGLSSDTSLSLLPV